MNSSIACLEFAARPSVFLQVVNPDCLPGLAGPFMIAKLPDGQPDVISSDAPAQAQITADPDIVAAIWDRSEAIRVWAYPERESLRLIEEARRKWT
ncbi:Scr1 family TA system antitoxin-like transcriptional regulator [Nonomuraea sp. NPDC026600]|uniref:Scr1 family TA system antitoxin-like transcriptional regulator n=1 Tax=Nonomuraea sp. NPDC026600 TaxID=3155363 RepID=UPI0033E684D1